MLVADEEKSEEARIDVEPVYPHRVVVIEEHARVLPIGVVIDQRLAGNTPVFGIAIAVGGGFSSVQMDHAAHRGQACFRAVQVVVDGQEVLRAAVRWPIRPSVLDRCVFQKLVPASSSRSPTFALEQDRDAAWCLLAHIAMR